MLARTNLSYEHLTQHTCENHTDFLLLLYLVIIMRDVTFWLQISLLLLLFRLHYDSNEELVNWKNALEESITEGLAEDSVLNEVYDNHSNRYCADCRSPGYLLSLNYWFL